MQDPFHFNYLSLTAVELMWVRTR